MYNQPCENCLKITWTLVKCNEHNKGSNKLNWENVGIFLREEGIGSHHNRCRGVLRCSSKTLGLHPNLSSIIADMLL